jgi:glutathione S-transferase
MTELRLYDYAASANCYKVRLLLAQLEQRYERVPIDIFAGETLTEEFHRRNPSRTTPVLEIDGGVYLQESNAILFYLAAGTAYLPDDPLARAQVLRWLIIEQTEVIPTMGGLRFRLLTGRLRPDGPEARRRHEGAQQILELIDEHLRQRSFLVADRYTIADIANYAYVHVAADAGLDLARFAAVEAWLARIEAQPGFIDDLEPYPPNARAGAGRSIYA